MRTPDVQTAYDNAQRDVLHALDILRQQIAVHGAMAAAIGVHWGLVGDLEAVLHQLEQLSLVLPDLAEEEQP